MAINWVILSKARQERERRKAEEAAAAAGDAPPADGAGPGLDAETLATGGAPAKERGGKEPGKTPPAPKAVAGASEPSTLLVAGVMIVIFAILAAGFALAQPVKAAVGQVLLERAFADAQSRARAPHSVAAAPEADAPWSWADMRPLARLRFPSLEAERLVVDAATGEALAWAPGHVRGTAAIGAPGVTAFAAHRDTHFALLQDLGPGDPIEIETADGAVRRYRVTSGHIVDARRFRFPATGGDADLLALSTCWPIGSDATSPERLILFAAPEASA